MSLQLRCDSVSVPHVFRCPVGPAHRPRNSTSHERSLIRHLPVLTPSPNPPLIHHLFSIFFIHTSAAPLAAKTSRSSKRKGAVTNSCCFCSAQPPSPSSPLRFVPSPFAISLEEKGSERARKILHRYHSPTAPPIRRPPSTRSFAYLPRPSLSFSPSSVRTAHAQAGGRRPPGAPSLSLSAGSSGLSRSGGAEIRPLGRRLLRRSAGE